MAGRSLPERTADELVTRPFEGDSPTRFDEGLYVAPDAGALLAAVERYCADAAAAPPAGTVVTRNPASASEAARGDDGDGRARSPEEAIRYSARRTGSALRVAVRTVRSVLTDPGGPRLGLDIELVAVPVVTHPAGPFVPVLKRMNRLERDVAPDGFRSSSRAELKQLLYFHPDHRRTRLVVGADRHGTVAVLASNLWLSVRHESPVRFPYYHRCIVESIVGFIPALKHGPFSSMAP